MRSITRLAAVTATALAAVAATAVPAMASGSPTTTTFSLSAGALSVSAPGTANLGTAAVGATSISGQLGSVTVTDNRGLLVGTWTASVVSTDFVNGTSTIPAGNALYTAGLATTTGTVTLAVPGLGVLSNSTPVVAQASVSLLGSDTATWNPTILVTLPTTAVAGTYTATITHSVA
jgi:hypothetical protein